MTRLLRLSFQQPLLPRGSSGDPVRALVESVVVLSIGPVVAAEKQIDAVMSHNAGIFGGA
jgi:hypothetical protein